MTADFSSTSFQPDSLMAGGFPIATEKVTLAEGQNLLRGAVLGKITLGAISAAAKAGGNTGGGTLTLDPTEPILTGATAGVYQVRCATAVPGGGEFTVESPDGTVLGTAEVGVTFAEQVKFSIADGTPDFEVGDGFDITIAAGSGKAVLSLAAARDGSEVPDSILMHDTDATEGDKEAMAYIRGDFNTNALTLGAGHSVASIEEGLRVKKITLRAALAA